jgi:hypothetical protein
MKKQIIYFVIIAIVLLIISLVFGRSMLLLSYTDEFIAAILFVYLVFKLFTKAVFPKGTKYLLSAVVYLIIVGIIGNLISKYRIDFFPITLDILACSKNFIVFFGILLLTRKLNGKIIIGKLSNIFRPIIFFIAFFAIMNLFVEVSMFRADAHHARFNLPAYQFVFVNPGMLINVCLFSFMIFLCDSDRRNNSLPIICSLFSIACTLRATAFGVLIAIIISAYLIFHLKTKLSSTKILIIGLLIISVSFWQIQNYFLNPKTEYLSRFYFWGVSYNLASIGFPIGQGFASFGSFAAALYDSPIYVDYGIKGINKMGEVATDITDCFWPIILGQFGFIGIVVTIAIFILMLKQINFMLNGKSLLAGYSMFFFLIIASLGNTTLFNPGYMPLFIVLAIIININAQKIKQFSNEASRRLCI